MPLDEGHHSCALNCAWKEIGCEFWIKYYNWIKPNSITLAGSKLSQTGSKPNSITLSGSKLVADRFEAGRWPASNLSVTSFEPDSVMEFGRGPASSC